MRRRLTARAPPLLLALAAALLLALVVGVCAAGNEVLRRHAACAAADSASVLRRAERRLRARADAGGGGAGEEGVLRVADFTAALSHEELAGWQRMPRHSATGWRTQALPDALARELRDWHASAARRPEAAGPHLLGDVEVASLAGSGLELRLRAFLEARLLAWTGLRELEWSNSYGPRTYRRGASLAAHGDRLATHALSAIVWVDERRADAPWPLQIVPVGASGADAVQEVALGPGREVLLYESTQPHGRVRPLRGDAYTVVFFHWRPRGWQQAAARVLEHGPRA